MDVDDFLAHGLDSGSDGEDHDSSEDHSEEEEDEAPPPAKKARKSTTSHKQSLEKLKEQDPEFFKFLQAEDKELLEFADSESEGDDDDSEDESEADSSDEEEKTHKPPAKLEVATDSEDSGDEEEEEQEEKPAKKQASGPVQQNLTVKMVNKWSKALSSQPSLPILHEAITGFKAAVLQANPEEARQVKYKVEGSIVFNAIVRMCLSQVPAALQTILGLSAPKDDKKTPLPSSSKKWSKARMDVKSYTGDVMKLMSEVADASILNVILKHIHVLVPYYACSPKQVRALLKKLIGLWSTAEETSRVLAFLSINKIMRFLQGQLLEYTIKQMYMAYVRNTKFTSPTTLPLINFMQRSFVEVLALDVALTYQYAFVYIRQLAIHLRNAITVQKKETTQAVYNWQFVHSLHLWARLLSQLYPSDTLQPLIYPLTQTIIGTIKLVPAAKYYPLRFHCVRALNMLSASTDTFIPVLPFLTEILELTDFNKRHHASSLKPFNFACILKLSKAQLTEKGFRDGTIESLTEHLLETFHIHAHTISFPELCLPALMQLKKFIKRCKVVNYTKQIRTIVEKVEETCKVINQRRKAAALDIRDPKIVQAWETKCKQDGTPLDKYYTSWKKVNTRQQLAKASQKDKISIDNIPKPEKPKKKKAAKEFKGLLETDSEDSEADVDDEERFQLKEDRANGTGKKQEKKAKQQQKNQADSSDEFSDFDDDELERLARSASEDEDDDDDDDDEEEDMDDDEYDDEDDDDDDEAVDQKKDVVEDFVLSSEDED